MQAATVTEAAITIPISVARGTVRSASATCSAGIVADSTPEYEQRECEAKAGALLAAAREAVARAGEAGFGQ